MYCFLQQKRKSKKHNLKRNQMKKFILIVVIMLVFQIDTNAQEVLELDPGQSMCISGKGKGQDGAINPFMETGSVAIVKNLGENQFSIRVEYEGKVKEKIRLDPSRITRVILPKSHVMYFDNKLKTKTEVSFRALQ
ncbi:MAG: hypothetical protein CMC13_03225 [Flavobacteriaceae bacterium]|nr:hypothetical protein [Flavobacteriaceae bacterium]|tara:strand:- start:4282 stop:4689 length:408 start_codon:yes stop_codon:yes gene_type:complete